MELSRFYIQSFLIITLSLLLFSSCNSTRKLKDGEYLLVNNYIVDKDTKLDKTNMEDLLKQKPNRKIFRVFRFHLWLHNLVNEKKLASRRIQYNKKVEKRNLKRVAKGKREKTNNRQLFREWLLEIGEPPVIYDSMLAQKSAVQLKMYLNNKGYFISSVDDSVRFKKNKKADVFYTIHAAPPYTIYNMDYKITDELVKYYIFADTSNTLIKKGNNYDVDELQKERERITNELNNNGYYLFTKEYIQYNIDTTLSNNQVNITLEIKNFTKKIADSSDSVVTSPHQRFYINNVYILPDYISKKLDAGEKDTIITNDYFILHTKNLRYKKRVLLNAIFIRKGELYQAKKTDDTYKRLAELKAFKSINIYFDQIGGNKLNCYIQLSPILKQSFTIETQGKNTSGNLGVEGSMIYQNRNLFRGAEVLELKLKAGVEAQQTANATNSNNIGNLSNPVKQFNTVEIGPEVNLYIPRFLIPGKFKFSKQSNPKTIFTSSFIYQRRPFYTRYTTNFSMGYTWRESEVKQHTINPLVVNFVKIDLRSTFDSITQNINDKYLLNSFINHLSTTSRYTFTYNEQDMQRLRNFSFFKFNVESSGNILRGLYNLANQIQPNTLKKDSLGRYHIAGIPYSQYVRTDVDYRYYFNTNEINKVVLRIAAGIGVPFINLPSLPLERLFFSGGSNGIRAWQSRTLGPGSYSNKGESNFDQFGDCQLEGNVEYRFKLFKMLHGAVFLDAGNSWLRKPDPGRVGGEFKLDRFYKEIALGSGIGARGDFNFFVLRLDVGIKVRDPQFEEKKRWVIQHWFDTKWKNDYKSTHPRKYNFIAFNIGIGYPF